jgi:DNA-binding beta-propeller fold protein YncE
MGRLRISILVFTLFAACRKDIGRTAGTSGYPKEIERIIVKTCARPGCHTPASRTGASNLSLATWDELFQGGSSGAVVVPYRPDLSTLTYYINSYPELGPSLEPRMPLNGAALSREEYLAVTGWILNGAPDSQGRVKFRGEGKRSKLYVANRLCDLVLVLDAETGLTMAAADVGSLPKTEFPVCLAVSPGGVYWYCTYLASNKLTRFNAATDAREKDIELGEGVWQSMAVGGRTGLAYCADRSAAGRVVTVDADKGVITRTLNDAALVYPVAVLADESLELIFTASETANFVTKIDLKDPGHPVFKKIIVEENAPASDGSEVNPIALIQHSVTGLCYAACRGSGEILAIDPVTGNVTQRTSLGLTPTSMAIDHAGGRLFVSCMDDSLSFAGHLGSVSVYDLGTLNLLARIRAGYQSSGLCVVPEHGYLAVVNSNVNPKGPAPHHKAGCEGRNGYITFVDLKTLQLLPGKKFELSVYPVAILGAPGF